MNASTFIPAQFATGDTSGGVVHWMPNTGQPGYFRWDNPTDHEFGPTATVFNRCSMQGPQNVAAMIVAEAYAMNDTYAPGVKTLMGTETLEDEGRTAQGAALATMRRREAQALEDLAAARRDLAAASVARQPITDPRDERVMPIWVQAARVAQAEGFCSEYDRLARQLNVPDRDELRDGGFLDRPGRAQVRVQFNVWVNVSDLDSLDVETSEVADAISDYLANDDLTSSDWWTTGGEETDD